MPRDATHTCTCGIGPWSDRGVCDSCGGIDLGVPALGVPALHRQLDFATDEDLVERLRRIEDDARYVRGHIERAP